MKRILAILLVLMMGVNLFTGCVNKTPTTTTEPTVVEETTPDLQLEKAIEYLRVFYKEAAAKTPTDYNRLGTVRIGITAYDVEWSVDVSEDVLKIVKNADGSYTIDINEEAFKETTEPTPYVLTATITGKDGRKLTISWEYNIPAAIDEESIGAIKKAYELAPGETLEGTYTVIGVITSINTPYDSGYKNITVTIEVAGAENMPLVCYRLKGNGADKLAVGDTITVTGNFMNYNGQVQFAQGCILEAVESGGGEAPVAPENPVDILKAAYALAPGSSLPYSCTLSGTITFVDQAYSADYGNITVTMNTHGYAMKCYRLKGDGVDQLNVNDEITVSGVITNYNGTIEFGSGCMLISRVDHEPPAKIPDPTPGTNLTVAQAYNIGMGKDHDTYTEGSYYITGTIVSIENDYYGNMHISDGSGKLMIYGSYSEDGKTRFGDLPSKPAVGDTITVYGKIGRYGSNPQMKNAWIIGAKGDSPVIPDAPSVDVVTELVAGTPYRFGMAQGNLENAVYYLAGGMNGYYMATTADPASAINVYVEETEGGYYFYTLSGEEKLYINMVVSADGAHVNGAYEAAASTVYTYDAANNTLLATVEGTPYWFGTRNDKTYTTMGPCKVELEGFFGQFYVGSEEAPEQPDTPEEPDVPVIDELVADKAYKFGMIQGNLDNKVFYLVGGMDGFYMATSEDITAAIDVYVEETEGGYYFYTLDGETKLYINMVVSADGAHVNGAYEAAASTIYTYNAEKNTLIAVVNDAEYWFSTRSDKTYTTMGPNKVSYNGFYGQFYDPNAEEPEDPTPDEPVVPDEPDVPDEPVAGLQEGVAYTISAVNGNGTLWFSGTVTGGRFDGSYTESEAVHVYIENVDGGFLMYFLDGEAKQYICMDDMSAGGSFSTDAASATVFEWNAEKATAAVAEDSNNRGFGVGATSTYSNFSAYDLSGNYNWGQFTAVNGGNTEPDQPEQPTCKHANTTIQGAKDKTCTEHGHTGMVVCSDCGEVVDEGNWIPALGHSYVDGVCGVCGEADPNYTPDQPDQPDQPTAGLQEGVAYTISADNATGTLWFSGTVTGGRFDGSYTESEAVHVYIENVDGGFLMYFLDGETKQYICMDDKSAGGSFGTDAASATVFEWNAEKATAAVAEDSNNRAFGSDATKTYTNFSCYDLSGNYNWGQFTPVDGGNTEPEQPSCQHANTTVEGAKEATCTENGHTGKTVCSDCGTVLNAGSVITAPGHSYVNGTCGVCGEADPNYTPDQPDQPDQPTAGLQEGVAYTISADNATGTLWFSGTVTGGRFDGSYTESEAVHVYIENVDGGFLMYFLDGETKQYICMDDKSAGGSFGTDAASATVFEWNAEKATAAVAEDSNNRAFGCDATKTYTNFSAYDLSGNYNWGQFTPVDGGSTGPELPEPCPHAHTTVKDAVGATCTVDGHTGRTVCADCGEITNAGSVIAAPGHNYVDGICGVCGETDPNATPDEPGEPEDPTTDLVVGTAYKFGMIQENVSTTDVYYLAGGMDGYYMATTTDAASAIDVYVEKAGDGYYFYTLSGETKQYINMVISGTHVNGAYEAAASTVYTYDAENNTLIAIVNDAEYWFATRNDNTYTTMGPAKVSYNGFFGQFYATTEEEPEVCQHANTTVQGAAEATCTVDGHTGNTVCVDCGEVVSEGSVIDAFGHDYVDGICGTCGEEESNATPEIVTATISFATTDARTSLSATEQIWEQNGITVTNQKAAATSDVADYSNPVRFYKNSSLEIAYPGMTQIEFACNTSNSSYATALVGSITDATVTADGSVVTVTFSEPQDSFSIAALSGQVRMNSITVTAVVAEEVPEEPTDSETGLVVGQAYKFGMIQENVSTTDVYYLAGGMNGYYMATTTDASAAIDVYVEETEGGYYLYTLDGDSKLYINMVVSGTHVNGAYEATASTVYTYDAENNTLIAIVNDAEYWFATRNDNTYTTLGPAKVSYNGFFGQFYA